MKKVKLIFSVIFVFAFTIALFACDPGEEEKKNLTYNGSYLVQGTVGDSYSVNVGTASGEGATGITYSVKTGDNLPGGLSLSSNGTISGVPTADGTFTFKIVAKAEGFNDKEASFTVTIAPAVATELTYTSFTLSGGATGASYSVNLGTATGSDSITYSLKTAGTLPPGLTINSAGLLLGTPTTAGTYPFIVVASSEGFDSVEASFSIVITQSVTPQEFIMECEFADLTDKFGSGYSGSAKELEMVGRDMNQAAGTNNGYYLAYTHTADLFFEYTFESDIATTGSLTLRLGSDMGPATLFPENFGVYINGVEINYTTGISLQAGSNIGMIGQFQDYLITSNLEILAGPNTIKLMVKENTLFPGGTRTFGPVFDCVKITSTAILSWNPVSSNIER